VLQLTIPDREFFDDEKQEFVVLKGDTVQLEHSLVSLSKWESKWHKPFLGQYKKTDEEVIDYIRCMTITQNISINLYKNLPQEVFSKILNYIEDPMTATWFSKHENASKKDTSVITNEIIYYQMILYGVPVEFQKWHLNRLLTLLKVCKVKNERPKKMGAKEVMNQNRALNTLRRTQTNSKG
jgi:hypothetical protein